MNHEGFPRPSRPFTFSVLSCWKLQKKSRATHLALLGNLGHRLFHLEILTPSAYQEVRLQRSPSISIFIKELEGVIELTCTEHGHGHDTVTEGKNNLTTQHSLPLCFLQEHSLLFFSGPPVHDNSRVRMEMKPQKYRAMNTASVCGARAHHL